MTVEHDTWSVERDFSHPPARVFEAWARTELKLRWFDLSDSGADSWDVDFRVGGHERFRSRAGVQPAVAYSCDYHDIVLDERIVSTYQISIDGRSSVVGVSTAEFIVVANGTRLRCTQQTAHLDRITGPADHRSGLGQQLTRLAEVLETT